MEKLSLLEMEEVQGGGYSTPSNQQVTCYVLASIYSLANPFLGIVAAGVCLFMD